MPFTRCPYFPASIVAVLTMSPPSSAMAQDQSWILQLGTTAEDYPRGLAADGAGGVFMGGFTRGSLASANIGMSDVWVARYCASGERVWINQFGTPAGDALYAAAKDGDGGVFLAGATDGDFGDANPPGRDAWLARYNDAGEVIWLRQFGSADSDRATALAADGQGGAFVGGTTTGDFGHENAGESDVWIAHYTAAGDRTWLIQFGSDESDGLSSIAADGVGGAFVAGNTTGDLAGPNAGQTDAWIARVDQQGNELWRIQFGTPTTDHADAILADGVGGFFAAGETSGELGGPNLGGLDAWLARFDSAGNDEWLIQWGTEEDDGSPFFSEETLSLAPDGSGGILVAGSTRGSLGGQNAGDEATWVAQFDSAGNFGWNEQIDSEFTDLAFAMTADEVGGIYIAGSTNGDLGAPGQGETDVWLAHYTIGGRANLTGFSMMEGEVIAGNERKLRSSNAKYLKLASEFTPGGNPPHEVRFEVKLKSIAGDPQSLLISIESRLNQNGGIAKVYLRNWNTGEWDRMHAYPIGKTEAVVAVPDLNPIRYIRDTGLIRMRIDFERVNGEFTALIDHVQALVR